MFNKSYPLWVQNGTCFSSTCQDRDISISDRAGVSRLNQHLACSSTDSFWAPSCGLVCACVRVCVCVRACVWEGSSYRGGAWSSWRWGWCLGGICTHPLSGADRSFPTELQPKAWRARNTTWISPGPRNRGKGLCLPASLSVCLSAFQRTLPATSQIANLQVFPSPWQLSHPQEGLLASTMQWESVL